MPTKLSIFGDVMTTITFIGLTVITMLGGGTNGMLIHCPPAIKVGVHLKYNWTPTLTNLRQRVDIPSWTSALRVTCALNTATPFGRKQVKARQTQPNIKYLYFGNIKGSDNSFIVLDNNRSVMLNGLRTREDLNLKGYD
jgi:hypothetical protein